MAKKVVKKKAPKVVSESVLKITLTNYDNDNFSVGLAQKGRTLNKIEVMGLLAMMVQECGNAGEKCK